MTSRRDQPTRAAIYARISQDSEGREVGVGRQQEDCEQLAARYGYDVVAVFIDNDLGASTRSRKHRPRYAELLQRARAGEFGAILAYSNSRLTRRPREVEDLLELAERHGVSIRTVVSGDWNLATADGRAVARTIAAWDAAEAERTGERVTRAFLQRAQDGKTHGRTPYGWKRTADGVDELDPEAAGTIREAARRALAHESLRTIVADLNCRGVPSPRGGAWNSTILRQVLKRERNAGRRIHHGQVIGRGAWEPILDEDTHNRLVALLNDPARRTNGGSERRHLLSGLLTCSRCGGAMRTISGGNVRKDRAYVCTSCYKIRRKVKFVDEVVESVIVGRLAMPDGPALLGGDPEAEAEAEAEADALSARLDLAADQYADGRITGTQLERITARLRPQIDAARARARAAAPEPDLAEFAGEKAAEAWKNASLDKRRAVVDLLVRVTILPSAGPGRPFDPQTVQIDWK